MEDAGGEGDVVDKSCSRANINTCGIDLNDLLLSENLKFNIDSFNDIDVFYDSFVLDNPKLLGRNVAFIYNNSNSTISGITSGSRFFLKRREDVSSTIISVSKLQDTLLVENIQLVDGNSVFYLGQNSNNIGLITGKKYYIKIIEYLEYLNQVPTRARIQLFSSKNLDPLSKIDINMRETSLMGTHKIVKKNLFQLFTSRDFSAGSLVNITGQPTGTHTLEIAPILFYNPQKGLYKSWGDIEFPWQITEFTPNLLVAGTDDRWRVSSYHSIIAYFPGDRVLYIEDDGYRISLYEANEHIFAISGAFDYSKWTKICHVETTIPAGLPSLEFLQNKYPRFSLDLFDSAWGDYSGVWSQSTYKPNLQACVAESDKTLKPEDTYTGSVVGVTETYNNLPVRGFLYVPEVPSDTLNVVVLYHGTITSRGSTPVTASQKFLDIVRNPRGLNLGSYIIFSVAYPQDAIPGWTQAQAQALFPGLDLTGFILGDNLEYAEASLLWAKNALNNYLLENNFTKQFDKIYTFGHSQGGLLVHRLNRLQEVDGVISNAPGPIDLLRRCQYSENYNNENVSCTRIREKFGSVTTGQEAYESVSMQSYLNETKSPTLFTQGLDDPGGEDWGFPQPEAMKDVVENGLKQCVGCAPSIFKYYSEGGHDAFANSAVVQRDIRFFLENDGLNTEPETPLDQCFTKEGLKANSKNLASLTDDEWYSKSLQNSLNSCIKSNASFFDFEKCLKVKSSDRWNQARVKRDFFYRRGDIVLVDGECKDTVCVFIALRDLEVTDYIWNKYSKVPFSEKIYLSSYDERRGIKTSVWQRIYCLSTGRNQCLEYQRRKEPELGYDVVEIGSKGHFVEMPVPYRLGPTVASLDERAGVHSPPRVLTQAEINALSQPQEE